MTKNVLRRLLILLIGAAVLLMFSPPVMLRAVYPRKYSETVEACAEEFDVPAEIVYAVIRTESGFDPGAVSSAGAVGLMQIMPATFLWLTELTGEALSCDALYVPEVNIRYGTFFLSYLYRYYQNYQTVFAAYNAGMGTVSEWLTSDRYSRDGRLVNIPYPETANYVKKVTECAEKYQKIYKSL